MAYMITNASGRTVALEATDVFTVVYPFVRDEYSGGRWVQGVRPVRMMGSPGMSYIAHGLGRMELTVISTHQPAHYHLRVFYTKMWTDPDGKEIGNPSLRVATIGLFERMIKNYQTPYHLYERTKDDA